MIKVNKKMLFSKKNISDFIDTYARDDNWHEIDKKTGNLGYGWLHYGLIRSLKPYRVLVIGSRYGFIPAVCAQACKDNKRGMVDFVDAGYDFRNPKHKAHWGGVGFWKDIDPKQHFGKFGLDNHISLYVMTSKEFTKKYPKRKWGYINLDGDHSYNGVKFDFETFWPRLKKGGFMSLHDIHSKSHGDLKYGVYKYWRELKKLYPSTIEFVGRFGFGLIQKV